MNKPNQLFNPPTVVTLYNYFTYSIHNASHQTYIFASSIALLPSVFLSTATKNCVLYICKLILISNQLLWYYINFDISVWINEKQCRSFIQIHTFINKFNLIYFVWLYCGVFADNNIAIWLGIPTVRTWLFGIFAECYFLGWLDPQSHPMTL